MNISIKAKQLTVTTLWGTLLGLFIAASPAIGQDREKRTLSLEDCLKIAVENNIDVMRAKNSALMASSNAKQAKYNFAPSVNGRLDYGLRNGLTFDQTAGDIFSTTTKSSNPMIFAEVDIFNGMTNHNLLKGNRMALEAALYDVQSQEDITELTVVDQFLSVTNDLENTKISVERLSLLEEQVERAKKRVEVGVANMEQVYNLRSQIANEKLNVVTLENLYKSDLLALLQTLRLDPTAVEYEIEAVNLEEEGYLQELEPYQSVYQTAVDYSPWLKSANLGIGVSERDLEISKAGRMPRLFAQGGIGTSYSSNGSLNPETGEFDPDVGYFDQLNFNQYEFLTLNVQIPIFNRYQTNNNIQIAKLNLENAHLLEDQARLDFDNSIQQAYLNLMNAQSNYLAAKENQVALDQSFKYSEASYNAGRNDFYTYLQALNNLTRGEITLINSTYSVILRKRILEIYKGL